MYYTIQSVRPIYPNELYHHGVKGQKWGVRRFQNPDGTLTAEGKIRYSTSTGKYGALTRDAARTGAAYKKSVKNLNRSIKRFDREGGKLMRKHGILPESDDASKKTINALSGKEKQKIMKLTAKRMDAEETEKFWRSRNEKVLGEVMDARERLGFYKNRKIAEVPTETLKNGQVIVRNDVLKYSGTPLGVALSTALSSGNPYAIAGTVVGGAAGTAAIAGTDAAITSSYKRRVEKESGHDSKKHSRKVKSGYYKNK